MSRLKTMSKTYFDDEIDYKDPDNGDIHLKAGVTRLHYNTHIKPDELESHINYWELGMTRLINKLKQNKEVDNIEQQN